MSIVGVVLQEEARKMLASGSLSLAIVLSLADFVSDSTVTELSSSGYDSGQWSICKAQLASS